MALQGNLHDMSVADLIQQSCQDRKTARLLIQDPGNNEYLLFFTEGALAHAQSPTQKGDEAVFQTLKILEGTFTLDTGIKPPEVTIKRSWSGLLLEGARRLDEQAVLNEEHQSGSFDDLPNPTEEKTMSQKIDNLLNELSGEINGYIASVVVGMDGMCLASNSVSTIDTDSVSAQMTLLIKLVDTSVLNMDGQILEDTLTITDSHYFIMRYVPGNEYFLGVLADRKTSRMGNLRLLTKLFTAKIAKAIPHA